MASTSAQTVQPQCYESVNCTTQPEVGVQSGLDSGFSSCTVPTYYCRSKYFYSQCPQVWNLIRTECSLNREEHRVKNKARVISNEQKSDYRSQSDVGNDQRSSRQ